VIQINYVALPHEEQKYIQGFGAETEGRKQLGRPNFR
jgi:hypothetical protein